MNGLEYLAAQVASLQAQVAALQTKEAGIPAWLTYACAPAGWVATPASYARYIKIGNLVVVEMTIIGTSNATTKSASLPIASSAGWLGGSLVVRAQDNGGAWGWAMADIAGGATNGIFFYKDANGTVWTNVGTCTILRAVMAYEV